MIYRMAFHIERRGRVIEFITASFAAAALVSLMLLAGPAAVAQQNPRDTCVADNGGVALSPGFCASVFADNLGHARQMAFGPNGVLYVNTWSGRYYKNDRPPAGGFLIALKDNKGDGRADVPQGSAGGTGIRIYNGGLYAEQNDKIIRYPLPANGAVPNEQPQVNLSGLP
ncbi:MAG: hypothetical protein WA858_25540, partial [Xanthobacteraceae bacterium]